MFIGPLIIWFWWRFSVPPSKAVIMDERGMEVQGPKVGPVLEGATLILTCDIIGGKIKHWKKSCLSSIKETEKSALEI